MRHTPVNPAPRVPPGAATILATQAPHPCPCTARHRPAAAEYERHHIHPEAVQRAQGLTVARLGNRNEWQPGQLLGDEQAAYWVLLCPTAHSSVHVLLRRYERDGDLGELHLANRVVRRLAAEGHRRVTAHGGWPAKGGGTDAP